MKTPTLTDLRTSDLTHALAMLLHSGISVPEALFLLAQEEECAMKALLAALGTQTDQGLPLSAAMEASGAFSPYVCGMVRVGEDTGRLEESLNAISDYCLERCRVNTRLRSALTYPGIILILMLAVIGVLLVQVLPIFDRVYSALGSGLTGIPALLLEFGRGISRAMPWLLGIFLLLGVSLAVILLSPPLRQGCIRLFQRCFGDRWVFRKFHNARFARGLSIGLRSGLMLDDALELACGLLSDAPGAEERARRCADAVSNGASLAEAMGCNQLLPPSACRILTAGIRSGNADRCMEEIADRLHEDAADSLDRLLSRIEPAMVLTASILVGLILLSVMLPLLNILNTLG